MIVEIFSCRIHSNVGYSLLTVIWTLKELEDNLKKQLKENGYMVIVIAKKCRKNAFSESMNTKDLQDFFANKLLQDVSLWIYKKFRYGC